jgi:hypothetical protein
MFNGKLSCTKSSYLIFLILVLLNYVLSVVKVKSPKDLENKFPSNFPFNFRWNDSNKIFKFRKDTLWI